MSTDAKPYKFTKEDMKQVSEAVKELDNEWAVGMAKEMKIPVQDIYNIVNGSVKNQSTRRKFIECGHTYLTKLKQKQETTAVLLSEIINANK